MEFQKYINHSQAIGVSEASKNKGSVQKPRVIKFVGNMQENIKQLLQNINCNCGNRKQFYNILLVFSNKIQKLRKQREHYKTTLKQYLLTMNNNSIKNQPQKKHRKHQSQRKAKVIVKKDSQQSTKCYANNKENQTPLKKVANLFVKEKSKTICISQKTNENLISIENRQVKNHLTDVKKTLNEDTFKSYKTVDKRMSDFYSLKKPQETLHAINNIENNDEYDGSFSLNLSSFEQLDIKPQYNQQSTQQCTKQVSSIMNQTNLLDSDDENVPSFRTPCKKQISAQQPQIQHTNKLKMLKQSTVFEDILLSLNTEEESLSATNKSSRNAKTVSKKKQNPEQVITTQKKSVKKADKICDKQNMKGEVCLKKFNITLQKLEEFIENKQCLKQIQKTQCYDLNLKNFKSLSTSLYNNRDQNNEYESIRKTIRPIKPLQERKFNFN